MSHALTASAASSCRHPLPYHDKFPVRHGPTGLLGGNEWPLACWRQFWLSVAKPWLVILWARRG